MWNHYLTAYLQTFHQTKYQPPVLDREPLLPCQECSLLRGSPVMSSKSPRKRKGKKKSECEVKEGKIIRLELSRGEKRWGNASNSAIRDLL